MLIFDFKGMDNFADRGCWEVAIVAPNRGVADQHLKTHFRERGYPEPDPEHYFVRSRMLERNGILFSNLEAFHDVSSGTGDG